jgi:hexosaminidase
MSRTSQVRAAARGLSRGILCGLVAVVTAVALTASGAAVAAASTTGPAGGRGHCTQTVTGTHHGALAAGSGLLCLDRATQSGPVRVWPGAGLRVTASVISGAVTTIRARSVRICGSTVIGSLRVSATAGPVTAGTGRASCRGDIGHGRLVISGSARRVQVAGLRQTGPVMLSGNVGGVTLSGGSVGGPVTVRGNRGHAPVSVWGAGVRGQ